MASYRISDPDGSIEDMSDNESQEEDRVQIADDDVPDPMLGAPIGVGCVLDAFRKCLLKRRGANKNDPYEYEVNEYVEKTGYYTDYDVVFHDSIFYFIWNMLMILLLIYSSVVYPMAFGFGIWNETVAISIFNIFVDVMFIMDITVNFCTTFKLDGEIVTDRERISKQYLRSWFAIDFVAGIPFAWLLFGLFKHADAAFRMIHLLKLFKFPELLKRVVIPICFNPYDAPRDTTIVFLGRITYYILIVHMFGCLMHAFVQLSPDPDFKDNIITWLDLYRAKHSGTIDGGVWAKYSIVLQWSIANAFIGGSRSSVMAANSYERYYSSFVSLVGPVLGFYILVNTFLEMSIMHNKEGKSLISSRKDALKGYLVDRKFPPSLIKKINATKVFSETTLLDQLPYELREELKIYKAKLSLAKTPVFETTSKSFIDALGKKLIFKSFARHQYVIKAGTTMYNMELLIVRRGVLEQFDSEMNDILWIYHDDEIFGSNSLLQRKISYKFSLRARFYTEVYSLSKRSFFEVLGRFPSDFETISKRFPRDDMMKLKAALDLDLASSQNVPQRPNMAENIEVDDTQQLKAVASLELQSTNTNLIFYNKGVSQVEEEGTPGASVYDIISSTSNAKAKSTPKHRVSFRSSVVKQEYEQGIDLFEYEDRIEAEKQGYANMDQYNEPEVDTNNDTKARSEMDMATNDVQERKVFTGSPRSENDVTITRNSRPRTAPPRREMQRKPTGHSIEQTKKRIEELKGSDGHEEHTKEQAQQHLKKELHSLRQQHDAELQKKAEEWKKALERPISPKRKQRSPSGNTWLSQENQSKRAAAEDEVIEVMPSTAIYNIRPNSASNLSTGSSVIEDVIKEEEEEDLDDDDDYDGEKAYMSMSEAAEVRDGNDHGVSHAGSEELHEKLLKAATENDVDGVLLLLEMHADEIDINCRESVDEQTPLICAVKGGHSEVVEILLQNENIDPNAHNKYGNHALSLATYFNHIECVRLLLQHPRIDIDNKHAEGDTALSLAKSKGHSAIIELFEALG